MNMDLKGRSTFQKVNCSRYTLSFQLYLSQCIYNIVWSNGSEGQSIQNWWYLAFHDLMHKLTSSLNVYSSAQGFYSF